MAKPIEASDVREHARGKWLDILRALAGDVLGDALDAKLGTHVKCPFHGGANDFRFDGPRAKNGSSNDTGAAICSCGQWKDGFALLQEAKGWEFIPTLVQVARQLNFRVDDNGMLIEKGESGKVSQPTISEQELRRRKEADEERKRKRAVEDGALREHLLKRWQEAVPLTDPASRPLWVYLASRGLSGHQIVNNPAVRFHPALPYYAKAEDGSKERIGDYPAMLWLMLDEHHRPATLHRTYLTPGGKKLPVDNPKKLASHPSDRNLAGGGIPLFEAGKVLGVGEGIETALAANRGSGMPVWSTYSAALMAKFTPPAGVEQLVIWADLDRSGRGLEAAKELKRRMWEIGVPAKILVPTLEIPENAKGVDWNDVWVRLGRNGFPDPALVNRILRRAVA